jgi:hypothetical protein
MGVRDVYSEGHPETKRGWRSPVSGIRHRHYKGRPPNGCLPKLRPSFRTLRVPSALGEPAGSIVHEATTDRAEHQRGACRRWLSRCPMEISEALEAAN